MLFVWRHWSWLWHSFEAKKDETKHTSAGLHMGGALTGASDRDSGFLGTSPFATGSWLNSSRTNQNLEHGLCISDNAKYFSLLFQVFAPLPQKSIILKMMFNRFLHSCSLFLPSWGPSRSSTKRTIPKKKVWICQTTFHKLQMIVSYLQMANQSCSNYVLSGLFKRGDGVNVYREESYSLALYYRCIRFYLVIFCHLLSLRVNLLYNK